MCRTAIPHLEKIEPHMTQIKQIKQIKQITADFFLF